MMADHFPAREEALAGMMANAIREPWGQNIMPANGAKLTGNNAAYIRMPAGLPRFLAPQQEEVARKDNASLLLCGMFSGRDDI